MLARRAPILALVAWLGASPSARAQAPEPEERPTDGARTPATGSARTEAEEPAFGATAQVDPAPALDADGGRARSRVSRRELEERQPRSTPDALRYEPGVSVQQTAHGQASPYVRGMTGQQVVHLFDGVRLNNGIYRQGPNQYFFTVDSRTVHHIDVIRGSASTRYGSDALGGAILAVPIEPLVEPAQEGLQLRPRLFGRYASADRDKGGRLQIEATLGPRTAVLLGGGYRDVGLLRSGGVVENLDKVDADAAVVRSDVLPWVPRFREELEHPELDERHRWRTQLGTGFREATFDARVVHRVAPDLEVVGALYGYRQLDAPRTDKCPPPEAPIEECLELDEQFRTLAYGALRGDAGPLRDLRLTISYQRHHERRELDRPRSRVRFDATDRVDTLGIAFEAASRPQPIGEGHWRLRYGFDAYRDGVDSERSQTFTDIDRTLLLSRGQYLDGSSYLSLGAFAELEVEPLPWLTLRSGGRVAAVGVRTPGDPESGSQAIAREMDAVVGRAGAEVRPLEALALRLNASQGFRAPNLDDLTSRQQTGPGFQFENPDLDPERSLTIELGAALELDWLELEAWGFVTLLEDAIQRIVREAGDCPPSTPQCLTSRNQFQLVNLEDRARIFGAEGGATVFLPASVAARATISYAWGDGPHPGGRSFASGDAPPPRVPLSRVPPAGGTFEVRWRHIETGLWAAGAVRWSLAQRRLAPSDRSDPRIPTGGTPGYGVLDLRAGWRYGGYVTLTVIVENVLDAPYRVHGSSIQGPGRGVILAASMGL